MLGGLARSANIAAKKKLDSIGLAQDDDTETKHTKQNLAVR